MVDYLRVPVLTRSVAVVRYPSSISAVVPTSYLSIIRPPEPFHIAADHRVLSLLSMYQSIPESTVAHRSAVPAFRCKTLQKGASPDPPNVASSTPRRQALSPPRSVH
jgi:hypothetical protein